MKKSVLLFFFTISLIANAQTTYVPDDNFEQALINLGYDSGVLDDYVPTNNIIGIISLDVSSRNIHNLTGIEDFEQLRVLNCGGNQLSTLDLINNTLLQWVYCHSNQLISLNLSNNSDLTKVWCDNNQLSILNLKNGNNTNIIEFQAGTNPNLTCIEVDNTAYSTTNWTNIDPQSNFNLDCGNTYVPDNNFEQALINLGYDSGALDNYVATANINTVTNLNISNKSIENLTGIAGFTALEVLNCSNNLLTNLDISQNTALTYFDCNLNQISNLDVTQNTALTVLACRDNQLTSLNLTYNSVLEYFSCHTNLLVDLDLSQNTALIRLWCYNNQLTSLNLKNGNNTNMLNSDFVATNNPNLTCIEIDDLIWSTANWTNVDAQSSFSEDCNATYIPDDNFEQALIDLGYDSGALDNYVTTSNIDTITFLNISGNNIVDLTGIEDFSALNTLSCYNNQLATLDISANTSLADLACFNNQLTHLDLSQNIALSNLRCEDNLLTTLSLSNNTNLAYLTCKNNQITSLDLTSNTSLVRIRCENNQLTNLDVRNGNNSNVLSLDFKTTGNPNLFCIAVDDLSFSISNWSNPANIDAQSYFSEDCNATYIPDDNFEQALIDLGYDSGVLDNYVTTANINTITSLDVSSKNITDLTGIEGFASLSILFCNNNQLSSIDISQNTELTELTCSNNQLTNLDIDQNINLIHLLCNSNQISSLNLNLNTALIYLNCKNNQLTNLDLSSNIALSYLECRSNQLTSLDLSTNTNLTNLYCRDNQITSLDLSLNTQLTVLNCMNNQLTSLDVKNGSNTNMTSFFAINNTNLSCINVDNVSWSTSNWTNIDSQSYFSTECNVTYIPDTNFEQALIDLGYDSGVPDHYVLTANINTITGLIISSKNITNLTGIEDFSALTFLNVNANQLTSLDLSQNLNVTSILCNSNQLAGLNISQNIALTYLECRNNQLTNLNVSQNTALIYLLCDTNQLSSLSVSQNTSLTKLTCSNNLLTNLDITQNTLLNNVNCSNNLLTNLTTTNNTSLTDLWCNNNQIASLNLSTNSDLTNIRCENNQLINLDLINNTALTILYCKNNSLTSLDVNQNTALTYLSCKYNQLSSLDTASNTVLAILYCENNLLSSLNIANGNNINMDFRVSNNPNLTCIQVDDAAWSTANWLVIDPQTSFSENCSLAIDELNLENSLVIYPNPAKDTFNITSNNLSEIDTITIYNSLGKTVYSSNTITETIDIEHLPSGIYMLKLIKNKQIIIKKIAIKK